MDGPHKRLIDIRNVTQTQTPKRELQNTKLCPIGDNVLVSYTELMTSHSLCRQLLINVFINYVNLYLKTHIITSEH